MSPPHILLIVLDTLRRDHLDCYGYPRPTAPALADFAARAIRFERAISPAHWTLPAHASLFTGRYPTAHQLLQVESRLGHQHPTLAEILRTAGWRTAAFCNNPLLASLPCGLQRGFSHFYSYAGAVRHRPAPARAPARAWRRLMFPLQQRAARSSLLFRNALRPRLAPLWTQALSFKGDGPASVHDLIAWLRHQRAGHSAGRHFVFLNLMGAHLPWRPAPATLRRIAPDSDPRALRYVRRFNARASRWLLPPEPPLAPQERQALLDAYDAEILQQDALLARLFRALRQMNALADTLVLIVADHGEAHGDHGFIGHGFGAHQELVQVPLILHDPDCRSAAGQVISAPVSTRRVFHTVLVAAGLQPPLDESDPESDLARLSARAARAQRRRRAPGLQRGLAGRNAAGPPAPP